MKHGRELLWRYWLPVLLVLALIKLESTDAMSGAHTSSALRAIMSWLGLHPGRHQLAALNLLLRKGGHIIGYGILGLCWFLLVRGGYWLQHDYRRTLRGTIQPPRIWWRKDWALLAIFLTFVVAAADELHQMMIPSRSGSWWDVALDTSSAIAVIFLIRARAHWLCRNIETEAHVEAAPALTSN